MDVRTTGNVSLREDVCGVKIVGLSSYSQTTPKKMLGMKRQASVSLLGNEQKKRAPSSKARRPCGPPADLSIQVEIHHTERKEEQKHSNPDHGSIKK